MSALSDLVLRLLDALRRMPPPHRDHGDEGEADDPAPTVEATPPVDRDAASPSLYVDPEGWLCGPGVVRVPSVRSSRRSGPPIGVLIHWTATAHGTADALARRCARYRSGVDRAASWHVIVSADGRLIQSVSLLRSAWHCAAGTVDGRRVNDATIGVELEQVGEVRRSTIPAGREATPWRGWPYDRTGPVVPGHQVEPWDGGRRHYHRTTDAQVEALRTLARALHDTYGIGLDHYSGHVDHDPKRKSDPGPIMMTRILPTLLDGGPQAWPTRPAA